MEPSEISVVIAVMSVAAFGCGYFCARERSAREMGELLDEIQYLRYETTTPRPEPPSGFPPVKPA